MNDELHNKVVKFFYDHEELFIAIMNKTPYQSDGWDYEIEVVKEFLTANQSCYCGDIYNLGVIHRDDGPCHYPDDKEPEPEPVAFYVYKPTLPRGHLGNVSDGDLPWVYDQDSSSGYSARMLVYTTSPQTKKPEQEPVAWVGPWHDCRLTLIPRHSHQTFEREQPLYTTPPQRTWVGLTDEEVEEIERWVEFKEEGSGRIPMGKLVSYISEKLRNKNT